MKNVDARTASAVTAAPAHVRAPSSEIRAAGAARDGGSLTNAFEVLFRRMRDHAASPSPDAGDSPRTRMALAPGGLSPPRTGGGGAPSSNPIHSRAEAARMAIAEVGSNARSPQSAGGLMVREIVADFVGETAHPIPGGPTEFRQAMGFGETIPPDGVALESVVAGAQKSGEGPVAYVVPGVEGQFFATVSDIEGLALAAVSNVVGAGDFVPLDAPALWMAQAELVGKEQAGTQPHAAFAQDTFSVAENPGPGETALLPAVQTVGPAHEAVFLADLSGSGRADEATNPARSVLPGTPVENAFPQIVPEQPPQQIAVHAVGTGRERLIDQIVQGVRMAQHGRATEVVVQLKPDFLGRLSIRVLVDDHGMRVEIRAENEMVRQVMQSNLADLQQRLSEQGLAFDQLNIFAETGSHSQKEPAEPLDAAVIGLETESEIAAEPTQSAGGGRIDYLA